MARATTSWEKPARTRRMGTGARFGRSPSDVPPAPRADPSVPPPWVGRLDGYYWVRTLKYEAVQVLLWAYGWWHNGLCDAAEEHELEVLSGPVAWPNAAMAARQDAHFEEQRLLTADHYDVDIDDVTELDGHFWIIRQGHSAYEMALCVEGSWHWMDNSEEGEWRDFEDDTPEPPPVIIFGPLPKPPGEDMFSTTWKKSFRFDA